MKKIKSKKIIFYFVILLIVFTLIFALNNRTLYISDDFLYKFEFRPGMSSDADLQPVDGLSSILRSQYHHYHLWNGRFVPHIIVQFFMQYDKIIFNIFNTLTYILLGLLIVKIGSYISDKKMNAVTLIIIYILMFLTIPKFGESALWISGSVNYLWMAVIYLGFYFFSIKNRNDNWKTILIAIILGFLSGATNENNGPATILIVILLAVYQCYKQRKISMWRILSIISSLFGFSLILFAPAATMRAEERGDVALSIDSISESFHSITQYVIDNYLIYLILILFLLLILFKNNRITEKMAINISILFVGFLGSTYSLIVVTRVIERTLFGPAMFLITIMTILLLDFFDYLKSGKLLVITAIPFIMVFAYVYTNAFIDIDRTYNQVVDQYEIILTNPGEDVTVPMLTAPETEHNAYTRGNNYLKENRDAWLNKWAAKFFGVRSIGGFQRE